MANPSSSQQYQPSQAALEPGSEAYQYSAFTNVANSARSAPAPLGGMSPTQKRMKIVRMLGGAVASVFSTDFVVCHYNPEELTEELSASYQNAMIAGASVQRINFEYGNPRKWSMKLLFNQWAEGTNDLSKPQIPGWKSVDDSISALRSYMLPLDGTALNSTWDPDSTNNPGGYSPPILGVLLQKKAIICHLTGMSIAYHKMDPDTLETIRATVQAEFTEYYPSAI